jgi:hypothetical protein
MSNHSGAMPEDNPEENQSVGKLAIYILQ